MPDRVTQQDIRQMKWAEFHRDPPRDDKGRLKPTVDGDGIAI